MKEYSEVRFTDDFMFCKVLTLNTELCRKILELILNVEIREVKPVEAQKKIGISAESKSIRLDIYVNDDMGTVYNLEMQTTDKKELGKRSRYYQGMIDLNLIEKGESYKKLNQSIIIFICLEDHFKKGLPIYTFRSTCEESPGILLDDFQTKVFVNASGTRNAEEPELNAFLDYLKGGIPKSELTAAIETDVEKLRNDEKWRAEYMTLKMREEEAREEGIEIGRAEGKEIGRAEGKEIGRAEGKEIGRAEGKEIGRAEGKEIGRAEGKEIGRKEGFAEGSIKMLFKLVSNGLISSEDAAKNIEMSDEQFTKIMTADGYSLPI